MDYGAIVRSIQRSGCKSLLAIARLCDLELVPCSGQVAGLDAAIGYHALDRGGDPGVRPHHLDPLHLRAGGLVGRFGAGQGLLGSRSRFE